MQDIMLSISGGIRKSNGLKKKKQKGLYFIRNIEYDTYIIINYFRRNLNRIYCLFEENATPFWSSTVQQVNRFDF